MTHQTTLDLTRGAAPSPRWRPRWRPRRRPDPFGALAPLGTTPRVPPPPLPFPIPTPSASHPKPPPCAPPPPPPPLSAGTAQGDCDRHRGGALTHPLGSHLQFLRVPAWARPTRHRRHRRPEWHWRGTLVHTAADGPGRARGAQGACQDGASEPRAPKEHLRHHRARATHDQGSGGYVASRARRRRAEQGQRQETLPRGLPQHGVRAALMTSDYMLRAADCVPLQVHERADELAV